jgi:hypothetical protein
MTVTIFRHKKCALQAGSLIDDGKVAAERATEFFVWASDAKASARRGCSVCATFNSWLSHKKSVAAGVERV